MYFGAEFLDEDWMLFSRNRYSFEKFNTVSDHRQTFGKSEINI